jgi:hypothetical protein
VFAAGIRPNNSPQQLRRENWPRSPKAAYNADLGGVTSVAREACTEGTRVDILERIYRWALDTSPGTPPIFWLAGQAGAGKSTIACTVARHFDEGDNGDANPGPNILGANFFCSRQFGETRRQTNIIPTLVYQLSKQSKSFADALLHANKFDSVTVPTKQMKDLLVDPWDKSITQRPAGFPPYLIVVDALDEIEDKGGSAFLQELLNTVNSGRLRGLKFFITSRPDPVLAKLCASFNSEAVCRLYEVPTETVNSDIAKYLETKLPQLQGMPQLSDLAKKADGLFIYAATAVRHICPDDWVSKREQVNLMEQLLAAKSGINAGSSLIDELYRQILWTAFCRFGDQQFRERLDILHTLLCTAERVSPTVAGQLLSDSEDLSETVSMVVHALHAVLYIRDGRVLWYHASFPDFMFDSLRSNFETPNTTGKTTRLSCDESAHHTFLAQSCFRVMESQLKFNICDLPSSFLFDSEVADLGSRVATNISEVLKYSCQYWAHHTTRSMSGAGGSLQHFISDFLALRVLFWIEAMNLLGSSGRCSLDLQSVRATLEVSPSVSWEGQY